MSNAYPVRLKSTNSLVFRAVVSSSEPAAARDGASKARQGSKSEAMYPPDYRLKPGAIGGRVAAHPAAPDHRHAHPS